MASVTLVLLGLDRQQGRRRGVRQRRQRGGPGVEDRVPERTGPEQPIPSFELTVKASAIASVRFSGAPPGGYLVCDEVRFTPRADAGK